MNVFLLGALTPGDFLRRHWQKRPLFVRNALPQFSGVLNDRELLALAARDDVESRIVERRGSRWDTQHGPFNKIRVKPKDWSILVSGVNLHLRAADALLRRFSFAPQARLDDVMVSYATPGGGVGPHVDSYDVFLLQGPGRRRWKVWDLKGSASTHVAERGDLLYLPPGWRHDGVALERCFTYSIGFRAPRGAELGAAFLDWLHERGLPDAVYRDPGLLPARSPARIPQELLRFAARSFSRISWSSKDVMTFLGEYLTLPKAHVVFSPGRATRRIRGSLVRLDPKTQLLYSGRRFFINGDAVVLPGRAASALRELGDRRSAQGSLLAGAGLADLISGWQRLGYLHFEKRSERS